MVPHHQDTHGVTVNTKQEVVGETVEVDASQVAFHRMKPRGLHAGELNMSHQFGEEGIAEFGSCGLIIIGEHRRYVLLDAPVVNDVHRFREAARAARNC